MDGMEENAKKYWFVVGCLETREGAIVVVSTDGGRRDARLAKFKNKDDALRTVDGLSHYMNETWPDVRAGKWNVVEKYGKGVFVGSVASEEACFVVGHAECDEEVILYGSCHNADVARTVAKELASAIAFFHPEDWETH